jgi:hypothetical protein
MNRYSLLPGVLPLLFSLALHSNQIYYTEGPLSHVVHSFSISCWTAYDGAAHICTNTFNNANIKDKAGVKLFGFPDNLEIRNNIHTVA